MSKETIITWLRLLLRFVSKEEVQTGVSSRRHVCILAGSSPNTVRAM